MRSLHDRRSDGLKDRRTAANEMTVEYMSCRSGTVARDVRRCACDLEIDRLCRSLLSLLLLLLLLLLFHQRFMKSLDLIPNLSVI